MELAKYKACICEGSAENAIMDILLDADLLISFCSEWDIQPVKNMIQWTNTQPKMTVKKYDLQAER